MISYFSPLLSLLRRAAFCLEGALDSRLVIAVLADWTPTAAVENQDVHDVSACLGYTIWSK
jgi:hypothetical protein